MDQSKENNSNWRGGKYIACPVCGKEKWKKPYQIKHNFIYCSKKCVGIVNAQRVNTKYKNKERTWLVGKNNTSWKGDKAGYFSIHQWVNKHKGSPKKCDYCRIETGKFEWANVSHKYKRDVNDYIRLCTKCHNKFDEFGEHMKKVRQEKFWSSKRITI